jgi:phosphatidylserine/phosphatidylglycerophosphate/cardiolipin synthase-like enzyme
MTTTVYLPLEPPTAGAAPYRQAHPYGPDGAGGFEPGLGIEIDPAQLDPYAKMLAVADGLVRVVPGPAGRGSVDLVLKPDINAAKDIFFTVTSSVVFVYRNLDEATVTAAALPTLQALPDGQLFSGESAEQRADRFGAGEFAISVPAGQVLGAVAADTGGGWSPLEFEVVLVPPGLGMASTGDEPGWDRLTELVAPAATTRRYDPVAFYALAGDDLVLAADHANHPLLQLATRRTLIEVRDEYDEPYELAVRITGPDGETNDPPPAGSRGTYVLDEVTGQDPAQLAEYQLRVHQSWLTPLPTAPNATDLLIRSLQAPAHLAVQAILVDPAPDDETRSWLVPNTGSPRYTEGNQVTPIPDGADLFRQYDTALRTATGPGHFIYINGWLMVDNFELVPGDSTSTIAALTTAAATAGAQVRALLWDQVLTANTAEVNHINALPGGNGQAILDNDTLNFGTHHQKCVIVNGAAGATAWAGGIDINTDRRDTSRHGAVGPFHDVHAKVEGPAVGDLHTTFVERWNDHSSHPALLPTAPPPFQDNVGGQFVQIARTYPPRMHYPFAPAGSLVPLSAVVQAIGKARKYIYIEEQYLTPYPGTDPAGADDTVGVLTALRAALARIDYLVIVIPNNSDQPQNRFRRLMFITALRAAAPNKVFVFYLARQGTPHPGPEEVGTEGGCPSCSGGPQHRDEIYLHSKVWIVDDIIAKIGSGNLNRRSYTHDSELDVVVLDGGVRDGARLFARDLRLRLWGEHLNLNGAKRLLLEDHKAALAYWRTPPPGARIRPYLEATGVESIHTDLAWNSSEDPDGR